MSANKQTTAIVLNPMARDGEAKKKWPLVENVLRAHGIKFDLFETRNDGNIVETVKEIAEDGYARIVAAGGDGTQNAVVNGLMAVASEVRPEYGLLPFGTANNIGKSFDLVVPVWSERALDRCARALVAGTRYHFDLGLVNGERYFASDFTIGFDAVVLGDRNANRDARKVMRNGIESYLPSLFKTFLGRYKRPRARAIVDGAALKGAKLFNLVVKNAMVYAGSFILSRDIRGNDGLLDVFLYTNAEAYTSELGTHVLKMVLKLDPTGLSANVVDLAVQNSEYKKGRVIEVRTDRKIASQVDGEEYRKENKFVVECERRALTLIVPYER
jgi:diacylglycerol kinase (ATP)